MTAKLIRAMKRGKKRYLVRSLVLGKDGRPSWQEKSFRDFKSAKAYELKKLRESEEGYCERDDPKKSWDLREAVPNMFVDKSESHKEAVLRAFDLFVKVVEVPCVLSQITTEHVGIFKALLLTDLGFSEVNANKYLRSLSAAFSKAVDWKWLKVNPVRGVGYVNVEQDAKEPLTFTEFGKFFAACPAVGCDAFYRALAVMGCRTSELAKRRWEDLNMETGAMHITGTKTRRARWAFLGKHSIDLMRAYWRSRGAPEEGPMFPPAGKCAAGKWSRRCRAICERADIPYYTPQNMRASYLPRGMDLGQRLDVGDYGLGHKPQGVGAVYYNRISDDLVRKYNQVLDEAYEDTYRRALSEKGGHKVAKGLKSTALLVESESING